MSVWTEDVRRICPTNLALPAPCLWDASGTLRECTLINPRNGFIINQKLKCFLAHVLFTAKQGKSVNFALPTKGRRTRLANSLPTSGSEQRSWMVLVCSFKGHQKHGRSLFAPILSYATFQRQRSHVFHTWVLPPPAPAMLAYSPVLLFVFSPPFPKRPESLCLRTMSFLCPKHFNLSTAVLRALTPQPAIAFINSSPASPASTALSSLNP